MLNVYIGYDPRESAAIFTCASSIVSKATKPVKIGFLARNQLDFKDPKGKEGYQQSNAFIFSRFLVPMLEDYKGWALFVDGDMIVRDDIAKLFDLADDSKAVMVVKHDYKTKHPVKYLGAKNEDYPRKNWSSVVLFNCGHIANMVLDQELIENSTGEFLHRFGWLHDDEIGELPKAWNHLEGEYDFDMYAKLVHWTIGGPYFDEYAFADYREDWASEYQIMTRCDQRSA